MTRYYGTTSVRANDKTCAPLEEPRRKLEPDPVEPRYVLTVYGVGYRFTDEV